jgi:hypothetical protein
MHSWFSNKIFDLFAISYRHEIFFVATEIIAMKLLHVAAWPITTKQLCVATLPCVVKQYMWQQHILPQNSLRGN